jgi:uncharacterized protein YjbI with pentapeptide repeats
MIVPKRAPVRPRVFSPVTDDSILLEEEVQRLVTRRRGGSLRLWGPTGSGTTTALGHLAHVLAGADILFLDCPRRDQFPRSPDRWVVFSMPRTDTDLPVTDTYEMAPWREDEWIEYLLATRPERCRSVMTRLWADEGRDLIEGNAGLCAMVLDRLAVDDSIPSLRSALLRCVEDRVLDPERREAVRGAALKLVLDASLELAAVFRARNPAELALVHLLGHRSVQLVLAADRIVADVRGPGECDHAGRPSPRDLVRLAAAELAGHAALRDVLLGWLSGRPDRHALATSLLHAAGWHWTPPPGQKLRLAGAYLDHVRWPEVLLPGVDLARADLSRADLRKANLAGAKLSEANLARANLREASLAGATASRVNLAGADLAGGDLQGATLDEADLERATLQGADLRAASLNGTKLTGASLGGADLRGARLPGAALEGADFSGADLGGANLRGLTLRDARFAGARFEGADLAEGDLEGMELPEADFRDANLEGALLTGSAMRAARFDGARLRGAGLAEVDWEGASLRGADLRGVSFHLGSTRSGLVGSPIACEGSRTGFYTDDYGEQDFKAPEEIRKANLCHADLRGARIQGVDFYLVDLRHALFDPEHERHLRRCGAILEDRGG